MRIIRFFGRLIVFALPIAAAVALLVQIAATAEGPKQRPAAEHKTAVRTLAVPKIEVVPRALGFGSVVPARTWSAIPEVSGRVIERLPSLARGNIIEVGSVILRLDPTDYQTKLSRAQANLRGADAELLHLKQKVSNTYALRKIALKTVKIAARDYLRKKRLSKRGSIAATTVDQAESELNQRRQDIQDLKNTVAELTVEQELAKAKIEQSSAEVALAIADLARTIITAPFTGRVASEKVAIGQFLPAGQVVAELDDISEVEVSVHFTADRFLPLLNTANIPVLTRPSPTQLKEIIAKLGVTAKVRFTSGEITFEWPGRFKRVESSLHPISRTAGVVIGVEKPYANLKIGSQPPLVKNMFVEVELIGEKRAAVLVIPRDALHGDKVFVAGADHRLIIKPVKVGMRQARFVTILWGLRAGENLVLSDPQPAIAGMLLHLVSDPVALKQLIQVASGKGSVR